MSFGISAAAWSAIGVGVAAAGTAYSQDQQRKAMHSQMDAARKAAEDDARKAAEAETNALLAANAKMAETKRRRKASALGMSSESALGSAVQPQPLVRTLGGG